MAKPSVSGENFPVAILASGLEKSHATPVLDVEISWSVFLKTISNLSCQQVEKCVKVSGIPYVNEEDVNSRAERCKAVFWSSVGRSPV